MKVSCGIATFTNLADDKVETIPIIFGSVPFFNVLESQSVKVSAAAASKLVVTAPASVAARKPFTITVTAVDPYDNVATGFLVTIHFTSTDGFASLPRSYRFTTADGGVHSFDKGMTLRTGGKQTIKATDKPARPVFGSVSVQVSAARLRKGK